MDRFVAGGGIAGGDILAMLSERELQVLRLIGDGRSTGEIASELRVSAKTISTYRDRLKIKLGIGTARDLAIVARDHLWG